MFTRDPRQAGIDTLRGRPRRVIEMTLGAQIIGRLVRWLRRRQGPR